MYTRCPECQTAFRITVAQLKVRDGLVRCGRCDSIFRADLRLFAPTDGKSAAAEASSETEMFIDLETESAGGDERGRAVSEIPVISDFSLQEPPRPRLLLWSLAALVLLTLWLAQFVYFYRDELAQIGGLRPTLVSFCTILRCKVADRTDGAVPELVQTTIAPHPRYANALRIRAQFVNRTDQAQPLPLMQVSISDLAGQLLARRVFTPREYVVSGAAANAAAPNVVIQALLDVTNPENKAASYEVQLFPQQPIRAN